MPVAAAFVLVAVVAVLFLFGRASVERRLLSYPTHRSHDDGPTPWTLHGRVIGFAREVESPANVWLMLHGNAGQASDRGYALSSFAPE
jgi:hypothetical protein